MRCFVVVCMVTMCGLGVGGCLATKEEGKKHLDDMLANVNALGDALAEAKDSPSAKAALPKIKEIGGKLKELKDANIKVSKSTQDEILQEYKQRMDDAGIRVKNQIARLSSMPGGQETASEATKIMAELGSR